MNHIEAMKLALDALEYIEHNYMSLPAPAEKAITALRQAIEQAEQVQPLAQKLLEAKQNFERNFGPHAMADWIYSDLLEWLDDTAPPPRQPEQAHECTRSHPHENMDALCELRTEIARLTNENARLKAEQAQPVAWMFQHEETGRTMCVDAQQLEWGFEKGNPRLKKIAPLYTAPPPRQPDLSGLKPETQKQMREWLADGSFIERAISAMQDQERRLMAYEKTPPRQPLAPEQVNRMAEAHGIAGDERHWFVVGLIDAEAAHGIGKENT